MHGYGLECCISVLIVFYWLELSYMSTYLQEGLEKNVVFEEEMNFIISQRHNFLFDQNLSP